MGVAIALTMVARVAGLVRGVLFARTLDRAALGVWALTNNALQVLSFLLVLGIPGGLNRYIERYARSGHLGGFLGRALGLAVAFAVLVGVAGMVAAPASAWLIYDDPGFAPLAALTWAGVVALVVFNLLQGVLQGLRAFRVLSWMQLAQAVGFAGASVWLVSAWRPDARAAAWAHLLVTVAVIALPMGLVWRYCVAASGPPDLDRSPVRLTRPAGSAAPALAWAEWRQVLAYSLGTWAAGGLQELWRVMDRYMLLRFDPSGPAGALHEIGSYHIAEMIAMPLCSLAVVLSVLLLPHAVYLWEERRNREAGHLVELATKLSAFGLTCVGAVLVLAKPLLLGTIFGDHTSLSSDVLNLVLATTIIAGSNYVVCSYLLCRERAWLVVAARLVCLVGTGLLAWWLIPRYQLVGAATATLAGMVLSTVAVLWLCRREELRVGPSTWWACLLPLALIPPPAVTMGLLASVVALAIGTNRLVSPEERVLLGRLWAQRLGCWQGSDPVPGVAA
jgi:O-antigen/teichoic acid export membrane protein